ncbi:MAG TPA: class I SAM-dependent methyltransferase [Terriglobales bacterium]|jgi:SAM-dependent methyltransferase|nr:class I SAM-dependent methyltransferase [Terriglobales bacterium]
MEFRQFLKKYVPRPFHGPWRYFELHSAALVESFRDRRIGGGLPLPPPVLRYRVHGYLDGKSFLNAGQTCAGEIRSSLRLAGKELYAFHDVLDFGCGCGRVLRYFHDHPPSCRLHGTDIDPAAIAWCRRNLGFAGFTKNDLLPPLPFPDASFDLLYAFSVFTHLDESYQLRWLQELKRVVKPGGTLMISTHGAHAQADIAQRIVFSQGDLETLQTKGFLFKVLEIGRFKLDGLPDFYQCAFHTRQYIDKVWSRLFKVELYIERGMNRHQDLVVLSNA